MKVTKGTLVILATLVLALSGCNLLVTGGEATLEPGIGSGDDSCLQGNWAMSNEDLNALFESLTQVPGLVILEGTLHMSFTEGDFSYGSENIVMHMAIPGGYMEAEAFFLFTASYATSDGILTFASTIYDVGALTWQATIDGETTEVSGPGTVLFPIPGDGSYHCSSGELILNTVGGTSGPVALIFTRVP